MQRIIGKDAHREGWGVGPPDDDGARPPEIGDDRGVLGRDVVAKGDNAVVGGAADLVGVDLGRDRYAVQRAQGLAPRLCLVGRVRRGERLLLERADHGVDRRVAGVEARQARLCCLAARGTAEPDQPRQLGRVQPPELVGHRGFLRASWIARQTRSGVAGMSMCRMPYSPSASTSAFITEGSAPAQPASPQPLAPSTLVFAGTGWKSWVKNGASSARGKV